jgi:pyruvate,water dikinase
MLAGEMPMSTTNAAPTFTPPGPGSWELETVHNSRPLTLFSAEVMSAPFAKGFQEGTARYGLLLSHIEMRTVNGFIYGQARPFLAPPGSKGPPPRIVFQLVTRLHPAMRKRIQTSHEAFERKQWREDLHRWNEDAKPASIARHKELQAVDVGAIDDAALAKHLTECRENVARMIEQHHRFTATAIVPIGDFVAHTRAWTDKPLGEILLALRGSSPISKGAAAAELDALGALLRDHPAVLASVEGLSAGESLARLRAHADPIGGAVRAYLDIVGYRSLGYEIASPFALEIPDGLMRAIRSAAAGHSSERDDGSTERIAALRAAVPEQHRSTFDELLAEARLVNPIRDERGHYSDCWAAGLARRVILEVGRRAASKGVLDDPMLILDASYHEMLSLSSGEKSVTSDTLRERANWRRTKSLADAPPHLGAPSSSPPPVDWLPTKARRMARAAAVFMEGMSGVPQEKNGEHTVKGLAVSPGVYEGTARVVRDGSDFGRIEQGDVLVAPNTSPYFNVLLPLLGGIVTDRGGQLSHAAIVAREYGIPGVVGTREATRLIPDGARVRVDGTTGEVHVLG